MRWGTSCQEHQARETAWIDRLSEPHAWFAWRPVRLRNDERWVWLETVARRAEYWGVGHFRDLSPGFTYRPWEDHVKDLFERNIHR